MVGNWEVEFRAPRQRATGRQQQELAGPTILVPHAATIYFYANDNFGRNVLGRRGWLNRVRFGVVDHDLRDLSGPLR